jgi:hypothetical protein
VINEAGSVPFQLVGLKVKCSGTIISVKRMSKLLLLHKKCGMVIFCYKCNQRFYVTDSFEEEEDFVSLNEVTYFTDPEAYLPK